MNLSSSLRGRRSRIQHNWASYFAVEKPGQNLLIVFLYNWKNFYKSKNLNCIWALSFYDSKRSIGEVFLITLVGVYFEVGNEAREKFWSGFGAEQNWRLERKESGFLLIPHFSREREIEVWKKFCSEQNFVLTCGFLKPFLFIFCFRGLIMILNFFRWIIELFVLIVLCRSRVINMHFINFADFLQFVSLYCFVWTLNRRILVMEFLDTKWLQFHCF